MAHFWPSRQTDASTGEIQCQLWTFGHRTSVLSLTLAGAGIGGGQAFFGGFQAASESSGAVLRPLSSVGFSASVLPDTIKKFDPMQAVRGLSDRPAGSVYTSACQRGPGSLISH